MAKVPKPDPYFWQFARQYLTELGGLLKPSTYATYKSALGSLTDGLGDLRMSEITREELQLHFTKMYRTHAPSTVRQYWRVMAVLMGYAESQKLMEIPRSPKIPRVSRRMQPWWTLAEMRTLIEHSPVPLKILMMILAETGCRIGEALALQTRHFDAERKTLCFEQGFSYGVLTTPKTDSSYRTVAISETLCYALRGFLVNQPKCFMFRRYDTALTLVAARAMYAKLCDRLKLPKKGFHAFRRGNITLCLRDLRIPLEVVSQRVGHLAGRLILDVYVQKVDGYDAEDVKKIARALYGDGEMSVLSEGESPDQAESSGCDPSDVALEILSAGPGGWSAGAVPLPA